MSFIFIKRRIGNKPDILIEGNSIKHILQSDYFNLYMKDNQYSITTKNIKEKNYHTQKMFDMWTVHLTNQKDDHGILIGFIYESDNNLYNICHEIVKKGQ